MAILRNNETGLSEAVPDDQVADYLQGGTHAYAPGEDVPVYNRDGTYGTIKGAEATDALARGYRIASINDQAKEEERTKYGGVAGEAGAAAAGVLRGLSVHLSDAAIAKLGGERAAEMLSKLKEYNPAMSVAGEVGGIALATMATGGGSLEAEGAAGGTSLGSRLLAATPAAQVSRLGAAAEAGVASVVGQLATRGVAGQILAKSIAAGVGGAVEGSLYSAGDLLSESVLGDSELTAERVMAHLGTGALLGAGAGVGLTALTEGAAASVRGVAQLTSATKERLASLYSKATGNELVPGVADQFAKVAAAISGKDEQKIVQFLKGDEGKQLRKLATGTDEYYDQVARKAVELQNKTEDIARSIKEEAIGDLKLDKVRRLVKRGNEADVESQMRLMIDGVDQRIDEMLGAGRGEYGYIADLRQAKRVIDASKERINAAVGAGEDVNANLFIAADQLKRRIGRFRAGRLVAKNSEDIATQKELEGFYDAFRQKLEDTDLFGKAAEAQKSVNEKWTAYLGNQAYQHARQFSLKVGEQGFEPIYEANPAAFRSFAENIRSASKDADHQFLKRQIRTRQDLIEEIGRSYELPEALQSRVAEAAQNTRDFDAWFKDVERNAVARNQLRDLMSATGAGGALLGGAAGLALGGPVGGAVGLVIGAAARPGHVINSLAMLDRLAEGSGKRIGEALDGFLDKASSAAQAAARLPAKAIPAVSATAGLTARRVLSDVAFGEKRPKDEREAFDQRLEEITSIVTNPEAAAERIRKNLAGVGTAAPAVLQHIAGKAFAAAQFLLDKAPRDPLAHLGMMPSLRTWKPSEEAISKWSRYVRAADNPLSLLEDLQSGRVTHEAVETVRALYPQIYAQIGTELSLRAASLKKEISYAARVQLSTLFGVPLDPTMQPGFIARMQEAKAEQEKQRQSQQQSGGFARLKIADRDRTSVQRITDKQ